MRAPRLVLALGVLLCSCGKATPAPPAPSVLPAEGDAKILQRVLDGALAAQDGLTQVAQSGGWPILTSQGYLFAVADVGAGPYTLQSPSGAFANTALKVEAGVAWAIVPVPAPAGATWSVVDRNGTLPAAYARYFDYANYPEDDLVAPPAGPHLERWPGVGDANIAPRALRVWVPAQTPTHFLYAQDGQNLFGPQPFGGWQLQAGAGPATLIVGIDNSDARFDEYTPVTDFVLGSTSGGRGGQYSDYLEHTVKPFIEARYGHPAKTGIIGSSLGGVIAYSTYLKYPATYDFAASLSGTMGWGSIGAGIHNQTVIDSFQALSACPAATLYLDSGGGPGAGCVDSDGDGIEDDAPNASDNYCENAQLHRIMTTKLGCGARVTYRWVQGALHNEGSWRARAPAILALFEGL